MTPDLLSAIAYCVLAEPGIYTAGQPTAADFVALSVGGIRRVIDLRSAQEARGFDEVDEAHRFNIDYWCIPVTGEADLTREKVEQLDRLLDEAVSHPTLVHCASSNRVGAMMTLRAAWFKGASANEALDIGRAMGLRNLEPTVRALLAKDCRDS